MADDTDMERFNPGPSPEHFAKLDPQSRKDVPDIRMQLQPPGVGGTGVLPGGPPEGLTSPEASETPEALRRSSELYTVEGADFIIDFKEALEIGDMTRIREMVEEAAGFMEGLYYGVEARNYDLKDEGVAGDLMDTFTNIEGLTDRPSYGQVLLAVRDGLTHADREAGKYTRGAEAWQSRKRREFTHYWSLVSQGREEKGSTGFTEEQILKLANQGLQREEIKVKRWVESRNEMKGIKDHVDARILIFDQAFTQRVKGFQNDVRELEAVRGGIQPDKGNWTALYQGNKLKSEKISEWGAGLSSVENKIEAVALGEVKIPGLEDDPANDWYVRDLYVNGFRTTGEFVAWLKVLLDASKVRGVERMDVVLDAWKLALWKGRVTKLAWRVSKDGEYEIGNPPFVSDLLSKSIHNDKIRAKELGWKATDPDGNIMDLDAEEVIKIKPDGSRVVVASARRDRDRNKREGINGYNDYEKLLERYLQNIRRTKPYRAISHGGHPMSVGRVNMLVDEYESRTIISKWEHPGTMMTYGGISLHDIAVGFNDKDGNMVPAVSRANHDFAWVDTEIRKPDQPVGEAPSGSVGGWYLDLGRAFDIRNEHLRKIPQPRELTIEFFESAIVRAWEKLRKLRPGSLNVDGRPNNPFAWYLASILRARTRYKDNPSKVTQGERGYRSRDLQNKTVLDKVGVTSPGITSDYDILDNALRTGAISKEEAAWMIRSITKDLG